MVDGFLHVLFSTAIMTEPMIMANDYDDDDDDGGDCIADGDAFILVSFGMCTFRMKNVNAQIAFFAHRHVFLL